MSDSPTDLLPLYESSRGFDTAMRGYDREQVDREVSRLDDDVRATAAERDAAANRSADLAAQLASAHAQGESLRRQLLAATETVTPDNVDDRVRGILSSAKADAAKLRQDAQTQAEQTRTSAADSAARTRTAAQTEAEKILGDAADRQAEADQIYRTRMAEADAYRAKIEAMLAESTAQVRAQEAQLTAQAEAERVRLDAEADARRARLDGEAEAARTTLTAQADAERECRDAEATTLRERATEDFEITLRLRRSASLREQAERKASADASAAKTVGDAQAHARQLIANATHEVRRLHDERNRTHGSLEALYGTLRGALDESLATTPAEPEFADTGSTDDLHESRPMPGIDSSPTQ